MRSPSAKQVPATPLGVSTPAVCVSHPVGSKSAGSQSQSASTIQGSLVRDKNFQSMAKRLMFSPKRPNLG